MLSQPRDAPSSLCRSLGEGHPFASVRQSIEVAQVPFVQQVLGHQVQNLWRVVEQSSDSSNRDSILEPQLSGDLSERKLEGASCSRR